MGIVCFHLSKVDSDKMDSLIRNFQSHSCHVKMISRDKILALDPVEFEVLYVTGGNPYPLVEIAELKSFLACFLNAGKLVIGISGGGMILGDHLSIVEALTPELSPNHIGHKGFGFVKGGIFPHSNRYETDPRAEAFYTDTDIMKVPDFAFRYFRLEV